MCLLVHAIPILVAGGRLPPARRGVLGWLPSGRCWSGRGLWVVARWVVTRIGGDKYPKPGESKN